MPAWIKKEVIGNHEFYLGNSVGCLTEITSEKIHLIVTSPPYDNLRLYEGSNIWDESVWKRVIKELFRVVIWGGVVVWIVSDATIEGSETGTSLRQALYFKEVGFNLHDTMVWIKDGGGAIGSNKSYVQNWEYMFVFSKGEIETFNLIYDKLNSTHKIKKSPVGRRDSDGNHKMEVRQFGLKYSRRNNYWYCPPQNKKRKHHPAIFPEKLARDHIISWSNQNDIVLDPFMGSGTTGIVCERLHRKFIGIEIEPKYFDIACKRVAGAVKNPTFKFADKEPKSKPEGIFEE